MIRISDRAIAFVILLTMSAPAVLADNAGKSFARDWQGRHVVVRQTLFALVYNERGKFGKTPKRRRDGLVVVTPFDGAYLQFDGRYSEVDVTGRDVNQIVHVVSEQYRRSTTLEMGNYQKIEPLFVARHEKGAELVVSDVRVEADRVRFFFAEPAGSPDAGEMATSLTVKWPVPFSKSFTERGQIERLVNQIVTVKGLR
jgi:hypothetical protein